MISFSLPAISNQSISSTSNQCKLEVTYLGKDSDKSGGTNALLKYIIQVQGDETYSILTSSDSYYCKVYIYSLDKEKRIDNILNDDNSFGIRNDTPHFVSINKDRPFTNILSLPLDILTSAKYGLVASVDIAKNGNNGKPGLVKGTSHTIKTLKIYSNPFQVSPK